MKHESHMQAFNERKETIKRWGIEIRGIENSQRIIGDNASKAIVELLSLYLHKNKLVEEGFQLNHSWFKSDKVAGRMPEFDNKNKVIGKMIELEKLCEKLSYGVPKESEKIKKALNLFDELEKLFVEMIK